MDTNDQPVETGIKIEDRVVIDLDTSAKPEFFKLKAPKLDQGRIDIPLPSTENLWLRVKVYASGGENGLHTHPYQDHSFVVLQGHARFYGPRDESKEIGPYEGVMLPAGCFYWFECTSAENLVMLRIGALTGVRTDNKNYRVNPDGAWLDPKSEENKEMPRVFGEGHHFE